MRVRFSQQLATKHFNISTPLEANSPAGCRVLCAMAINVTYDELRALGAWYGHAGISAGYIEVDQFVHDVVRTNLAALVPPIRVKVKRVTG